MTYSAIIESLHEQLQWPEPPAIFHPEGAGPAMYARLARRKLAEPLRQRADARGATVGILTTNPDSDDSDAPVAIVCEFPRPITQETVREAHRLAWNFCRSPLLITIEPHLIRSWSCYETPNLDDLFPPAPVEEFGVDDPSTRRHLVDSLHWIELASGSFLARRPDRFPSGQRADETLLDNLGYVRERLTSQLPEEIAHDLLARLIFVQFLCHRKDSGGRPALNANVLRDLHEKGILSRSYTSLPEVLRHKGDTYALFEWLDERFNGDLFPDDWREEKACVKASHLRTLADFVSGELEMRRGQRCLWPLYSFDAIPLEFVSSIYEEFVKKGDDDRGVGEHYTPAHIVDFVLDKVLPWGGTDYDVRVLDPACGSAAFLVKAFQRLVNRWRSANPGQDPPASFLRNLIEANLFGVDVNSQAIRVASFSLYLAMCDEIDPRHYWTQVRFPRLREARLRSVDFFSEDVPGIRTAADAARYDLVVGNAPWGEASMSKLARSWARANGWRPAQEQIGTLFLPKAAQLTAPEGRVCMIQPASALLFNRNSTALNFRRSLFERFQVEEVTNLSALRFHLFPNAVGPACIVLLRPTPPDGSPISYCCPKQSYETQGRYRILLDAHDYNWVDPREAARDPIVWSCLTWGGRRDLELLRRLRSSGGGTLEKALSRGTWKSDPGFKRVPSGAHRYPDRKGLPVLESHDLWNECPNLVNASWFPLNDNEYFERPRELESYRLPAVLLKAAWTAEFERFKAVVVTPTAGRPYLLYSQSFFALRGPDEASLGALAVALNSSLAVHYFYLASGRLASYRPTLRKVDIEQMPLPARAGVEIRNLEQFDVGDFDRKAFELYELAEFETVLIEDFVNVTLRDYKGTKDSMGRRPLTLGDQGSTAALTEYCKYFIEVLQAGFGTDKRLSASVWLPQDGDTFPLCVAAVHLESRTTGDIDIIPASSDELRRQLTRLGKVLSQGTTAGTSIGYQRVARVYDTTHEDRAGRRAPTPTVLILKPNQRRYWTRSIAMRDADEVAADILQSNLVSTE